MVLADGVWVGVGRQRWKGPTREIRNNDGEEKTWERSRKKVEVLEARKGDGGTRKRSRKHGRWTTCGKWRRAPEVMVNNNKYQAQQVEWAVQARSGEKGSQVTRPERRIG